MPAAPEPGPQPLPADVAAIRERLVALERARADGSLDEDAYAAARRDAERALGDAVMASSATPDASMKLETSRPSARLVVSLVVLVVVIAVGGYAFTGSPSLAGLGATPPPVATEAAAQTAASKDREEGLRQIAAMVDTLATRLKDRPDDAEGWTMLARSYTVLSRFQDAVPAYRKAVALRPNDAALLADFSDALAATNGGKANAESTALLDRALAADPRQPKALALAGTVAFDAGDFAGAVRHWQKIADALPPDSDFHRQVVANIDEAKRRGGLAAPSPAAQVADRAPAATGRPTATPPAEAVTGTVTLAASVAARAAPDDTVFVLARPQDARMPLAVFRATVRDLPLRFQLDDSMAMTPAARLSGRRQVIVAARVSRSGNPIPQPGDLAGESAAIAPGTRDLSIVIDDVVGAR